ncbi:Nickel/cobalt efflux system [Mycena indigotica]|uniref:Nickel/cobalt efflux system n=1 Tax=Mycena indigotica TaxID=2126181 RepID=A0A8H6SG95_9AGAR|nr:Nickel/cobalt efflux system [Mycena indigotica]KAF7299008.1 Nickel/cobalt efflux system [Mycena indigotica]
MYPVGVLFGLGFDTASSIALLSVSALAHRQTDGSSIPSSQILVLPVLFTAGMSLIDSTDSVIMLYSYTDFAERRWTVFERSAQQPPAEKPPTAQGIAAETQLKTLDQDTSPPYGASPGGTSGLLKFNVMSNLSIILTLISILVALSISLITIMGLIGEQCKRCQEAANDPNGGGLAGSWWRGWAQANEQSGWIGIAIVGSFVLVVAGWYGFRRFGKRTVQAQHPSPNA